MASLARQRQRSMARAGDGSSAGQASGGGGMPAMVAASERLVAAAVRRHGIGNVAAAGGAK